MQEPTQVRSPTLRFAELLVDARAGSQRAWDEVYAFVDDKLGAIVGREMASRYRDLRRWIDEGDAIVETQRRLWPYLQRNTPASTRELFGITARLVGQVLVDFCRHLKGPEGFGRNHHSFGDDDGSGGAAMDRFAGRADDPARGVELDEIVAAIERLPAEHREAMRLRYLAQLTVEDVGEVVGVSTGKAHRLIREGEAALGRMFPEAGPPDGRGDAR